MLFLKCLPAFTAVTLRGDVTEVHLHTPNPPVLYNPECFSSAVTDPAQGSPVLCPSPPLWVAAPFRGGSESRDRPDYLTVFPLDSFAVLTAPCADPSAPPGLVSPLPAGSAGAGSGSGCGSGRGRGHGGPGGGAMSASAVYVLDLKGKVRPGCGCPLPRELPTGPGLPPRGRARPGPAAVPSPGRAAAACPFLGPLCWHRRVDVGLGGRAVTGEPWPVSPLRSYSCWEQQGSCASRLG